MILWLSELPSIRGCEKRKRNFAKRKSGHAARIELWWFKYLASCDSGFKWGMWGFAETGYTSPCILNFTYTESLTACKFNFRWTKQWTICTSGTHSTLLHYNPIWVVNYLRSLLFINNLLLPQKLCSGYSSKSGSAHVSRICHSNRRWRWSRLFRNTTGE